MCLQELGGLQKEEGQSSTHDNEAKTKRWSRPATKSWEEGGREKEEEVGWLVGGTMGRWRGTEGEGRREGEKDWERWWKMVSGRGKMGR